MLLLTTAKRGTSLKNDCDVIILRNVEVTLVVTNQGTFGNRSKGPRSMSHTFVFRYPLPVFRYPLTSTDKQRYHKFATNHWCISLVFDGTFIYLHLTILFI